MQAKKFFLTFSRTLVLLLFVLLIAANAFAEQMLHSFVSAAGGLNPNAGLIADKAGNLYGTTLTGGTYANCSCGTVFELSPPAVKGGTWTETVLYSFRGEYTDGQAPMSALTFDEVGNLYGTTLAGGGSNSYGTVFELSPPGQPGGAWTETVLFFFNLIQGSMPVGQLVFDEAGNLYGTTLLGGDATFCNPGSGFAGCGTVFQLTPPVAPGGTWTESVLHAFGALATDGQIPEGLTFQNGVLYGTTGNGGTNGAGTVFQLVSENGTWTENILYNFTGAEGYEPAGALIFDSAGDAYGVTARGGGSSNCQQGCGAVFELSPPAAAGDSWQETTLYRFTGRRDGSWPVEALVRDKSGNLYGTATQGGLSNKRTSNNGTVFKVSPPTVSGGAWTEIDLQAFAGSTSGDGSEPFGGLVLAKGRYYGTTYQGGAGNSGTVFAVSP
jgi:uncharacterized repeat protein (TIGR03803 family)